MSESSAPIVEYSSKYERGGVDYLRIVFLVLALPALAVPFVRCWFGEAPSDMVRLDQPVILWKALTYFAVYPLLAWKAWSVIKGVPRRWGWWVGYGVAAMVALLLLMVAGEVLILDGAKNMMGGFLLVYESLLDLAALVVGFGLILFLALKTRAHAFVAEAAMVGVLIITALPGGLVTTGNSSIEGSAVIWWTLGAFVCDFMVLVVRAWINRVRYR